jgi:uncharacterized protein YkwD
MFNHMRKVFLAKRPAVFLTAAAIFSIAVFVAQSYGASKAKNDFTQTRNDYIQELNRKTQELNYLKEQNQKQRLEIEDLKKQITFNPENLLAYTNEQRERNGLKPLRINQLLNRSALLKAEDMKTRNYWSHDDPEGRKAWYIITGVGYRYSVAGENLANGYVSGIDAIAGWMKSPSHRDNILKEEYKEVGFGVLRHISYQGLSDNTLVVAHYGRL